MCGVLAASAAEEIAQDVAESARQARPAGLTALSAGHAAQDAAEDVSESATTRPALTRVRCGLTRLLRCGLTAA